MVLAKFVGTDIGLNMIDIEVLHIGSVRKKELSIFVQNDI